MFVHFRLFLSHKSQSSAVPSPSLSISTNTQAPHESVKLSPAGIPAQSAHEEFSPAHIPQSSNATEPPQFPPQSLTDFEFDDA